MTTPPPYEQVFQNNGFAAVSGRLRLPTFDVNPHVTRVDPAPKASAASSVSTARPAHEAVSSEADAVPVKPHRVFTAAEYRQELARCRRARKRNIILAIAVTCVVVAVAVLGAAGFSPLRVSVTSMEPTLTEGQIVVVAGRGSVASGEVVAYDDGDGNPQLGRVVAEPGDWVSIAADGTVAVSEFELSRETALSVFGTNLSSVTSRIVPEGRYYVLGDAEQATMSGLQTEEDFVDASQISGRAVFFVWPITSVGPVA